MNAVREVNGREDYYRTLTRVGQAVDRTLSRFLDEDTFGKAKRTMYGPFLSRKWGGQKLRATLTYLSYCAFTGRNPAEPIEDENLLRLMTSTELELWAEYSANWIFDNKGQVRTNPLNRKKAAVSTKSFLEDAVRMAGQVGKEFSDLVLDTSGYVTESFSLELIMDMSNRALLDGPLRDYMDMYRRDYAIPGIGRTLSLGGDLAALYSGQGNSKRAEKLRAIFLEHGIELEVLNDLGDFCMSGTSTDKVASDQFSDIRNGAMTPPIWLMHFGANEDERRFIHGCVGKTELTREEELRLVRTLFESGSYDLISKGLKKAGRNLKKAISGIGFHNDGSALLQQAITILESNKIYGTLKEDYREVTGTDWKPESGRDEQNSEYRAYLDESYAKFRCNLGR